MNKALGLAGALGLGAGLMYLLDPNAGARRRARMRGQARRAMRRTEGFLATASRDLANRTRGVAAETRGHLFAEPVSDAVLVERVRARLGRVASHPRAIHVTAEDGHVTLRGRVPGNEMDPVTLATGQVRGACGVANRLTAVERADLEPDGSPPRAAAASRRYLAPGPRLLALAGGGAAATLGLRRGGALGTGIGALGAIAVARGVAASDQGRTADAPGEAPMIQVDQTIALSAPPNAVFAFMQDYANFPRFMPSVREVRALGEGISRWVVSGPVGATVQWDARETCRLADQRIAWETTEDQPIRHAGAIAVRPGQNGGTELTVRMQYRQSAGALGHAAAWVFAADPGSQLGADLSRVKAYFDRGKPARDGGRAEAEPKPGHA
ncbi:MAG: SRPBCC family protein [Chthonomonadales bacterium]|nr:SRPBCC family protein [Chthonomonadales bacterium]